MRSGVLCTGVGCDVARCHPRRCCHNMRRQGVVPAVSIAVSYMLFPCFQCCVYGSICLPRPFAVANKSYAVFMVGEEEMLSTDLSIRLSLLNLVLCHSYGGCVLPSILNRSRGH